MLEIVRLCTSSGETVGFAAVLPVNAEAILWGQRIFFFKMGAGTDSEAVAEYQEGIATPTFGFGRTPEEAIATAKAP